MVILVAYASARGSTQGVAECIRARLEAHGLDVEIASARDVMALARYDAVVLGSAIYGGAWLEEAVACLGRPSQHPGHHRCDCSASAPWATRAVPSRLLSRGCYGR